MLDRFRYFYDDQGYIIKRQKIEQGLLVEDDGNYVDIDGFYHRTLWRWDTATNTMVKRSDHNLQEHQQMAPKQERTWDQKRRKDYGTSEQQMNWLYDDIKDGKFGETAKTGKWYLHIKAVKERHPKD